MVSWGTIQSLVLFLGPLILPKAIAFYRSIKNRPSNASSIKPLSSSASIALGILFTSGVVAFLSTLPIFAPENIFRLTQSRLHTSGGVLLTRLGALRPVTGTDQKLREVFDAGGLEARLLYVRYGPNVLIENTLGQVGEIDMGRNFFLYALPGLLGPHLAHLFALGIATSGTWCGTEGAKWRTIAVILGMVVAVLEVYFVVNYDDARNLRSVRYNDVDFLFWKMRVWRGIGVAAVDAGLGWCVWAQATGRAWVGGGSAGERLRDQVKVLEGTLFKARGVGVVRNGVVRDAGLRRRVDDYWMKEGEVMKDVIEQPEVLEAQRNALKRMNAAGTAQEAEAFINILLDGPSPQQLPAGR
ncbi:hypothetical protein CKM354_000741300 [Cercospora kikuchii]|uniref:Uncharacterized protein n=1 Tax=Cercospora kikuchii TaxID=84275 RepID=A0A9P3CJY3_9PEZI|nr:uncharacterized protein CKM354_000741300 [Cercospora kikuchii]GIZ44209.1 hypothetical protein CKM354_000741300 [Cercospora kikuchii]